VLAAHDVLGDGDGDGGGDGFGAASGGLARALGARVWS
jgi:hypothetical protein